MKIFIKYSLIMSIEVILGLIPLPFLNRLLLLYLGTTDFMMFRLGLLFALTGFRFETKDGTYLSTWKPVNSAMK